MKNDSLVLLLIICAIYANCQNYLCNFDEECPYGYACYSNYCKQNSQLETCFSNSSCGSDCCINYMCRIASQKICTSLNTNICTTSLNCAANCCYNNVCRIGTYCGIAAEGYSCTSN